MCVYMCIYGMYIYGNHIHMYATYIYMYIKYYYLLCEVFLFLFLIGSYNSLHSLKKTFQ